MTKDEALKMVIEHGFKRVIEPPCEYYKATEEQIEAFAKALAEQPSNMVTVPLNVLEDMQRRLKTSQEPVAWTTKFALEVCKDKLAFEVSPTNIWDSNGVALYTHPPKEWQGLSDEEILEIDHDMAFARAIEAKLRELNG